MGISSSLPSNLGQGWDVGGGSEQHPQLDCRAVDAA